MTDAKKLILVLIAGFLSLSLLSWLPSPDAKDIVRFLLNTVLCWFLWKGVNWIRWVLGALAAVACLVAIVSVLRTPMQVEAIVVLAAMLLFYGFAAFALLSGKWVASHCRAETPNNPLQPTAREDARSG
jgi:hypothetical protein